VTENVHTEEIAGVPYMIRSVGTLPGGTIMDPGMFEGQPRYVPHFWAVFLMGMADRDDGRVLKFQVTREDKKQFPELRRRGWVSLVQSDQGFITEV